MKTLIYRTIPVWLALVFGVMLAATPASLAQSADCRDAAGAPIPCTPTPRPTDVPVQIQPTALPTNTPEPTAIPLIPLPTTGDCVASPASPVRVNVRETASTDGKILESILVNSTVPVVAGVDYLLTLDGVPGESEWVVMPNGFIAKSALRFGGENCDRLVKIYPPSSTGPFILRQDTDGDGVDDTQYMTYKLQDVLISSATGQPTTTFDPTDTTIFWPPFDPAEPIALLLPAVQMAREAAARMGEGCGDTTVFDPSTATPGCVVILDDLAIFCTMDVCFGEQTTGQTSNNLKQLALAAVEPSGEPYTKLSKSSRVVIRLDYQEESAQSPLIPPLIFIPQPSTTEGDNGEIECADVEISVGPVGIGGCLMLGSSVIAFCVSDWCVYGEF